MWKTFLKGFERIIFPQYCLNCQAHIENKEHVYGVCIKCLNQIKYINTPFCLSCGKGLNDSKFYFCSKCKDAIFNFSRGWSVCRYEGVMLKLIHQFKYRDFSKLHKLFNIMLIEFIEKYIPIDKIDCILAVPLHKKKLSQRGFNQAHLLAEPIAKHFNKTYLNKIVGRVKYTPSQTKLDRYKRFENLNNAFSVIEKTQIKNRNIMIIDDVFTTGATISALSAELKKSEANSIVSLTLAQ